eukprot:8822134-Pyramimonas_sp.AAC.1
MLLDGPRREKMLTFERCQAIEKPGRFATVGGSRVPGAPHERRAYPQPHPRAVWIPGPDPADTRSHGYVPRGASAKNRPATAGSRPRGHAARCGQGGNKTTLHS